MVKEVVRPRTKREPPTIKSAYSCNQNVMDNFQKEVGLLQNLLYMRVQLLVSYFLEMRAMTLKVKIL